MERNSREVVAKCVELKRFWEPRNKKMRSWYRLIQQVDELATEDMESFVGNDARAMYNLVLHMLCKPEIPHRIENVNLADFALATVSSEVSRFFDIAWRDVGLTYRTSTPGQSMKRTFVGFMLATGWYSMFAILNDNGKRAYAEVWHPAEVFPMWDFEMGLDEVAHIFSVSNKKAKRMMRRNNWGQRLLPGRSHTIYDYWWMEDSDIYPFRPIAWNAIVVDSELVKFQATRFNKIPVYVSPVGGLPDTGPLSEGVSGINTSTSSDRWKEEIGQALPATNEHIYRTWNKWWTFALQLLRDTAQPRIFERSRTGKHIVKPEDIFKRGAVFRGGPEDSVEFIGVPPLPLELRSTQLDLEAMMQRGGVSWALYGNVQGAMTAYVMSQVAASAEQATSAFHQGIVDCITDIDNDWLDDIRQRGITPYGWELPVDLPEDAKVTAEFDIEIPGDLIQRATVARMLDPDFRLSYSYVMSKLFPEIKDLMQEKAAVRADVAEAHPSNAFIALVVAYKREADWLEQQGDQDSARLYRMVADATEAGLTGSQQQQQVGQPLGGRPEGLPPSLAEPPAAEGVPQLPVGRGGRQ